MLSMKLVSHLMALISSGDPYLPQSWHRGLQNGDFPYSDVVLQADCFFKHTHTHTHTHRVFFFSLFDVNMALCVCIYLMCLNELQVWVSLRLTFTQFEQPELVQASCFNTPGSPCIFPAPGLRQETISPRAFGVFYWRMVYRKQDLGSSPFLKEYCHLSQ